jgi:hypothetical protein
MKKDIVDYLDNLGFKHSTLGYVYLNEAVEIGLERRSSLSTITGPDGLYSRIARKFNAEYGTIPSRVERAIRHSIQSSDFINKSSNGAFISKAIDAIAIERQGEADNEPRN